LVASIKVFLFLLKSVKSKIGIEGGETNITGNEMNVEGDEMSV